MTYGDNYGDNYQKIAPVQEQRRFVYGDSLVCDLITDDSTTEDRVGGDSEI